MDGLEKEPVVVPPEQRVPFSLDRGRKGSRLIVVAVPEGKSRTQLIRLGVLVGEAVRLVQRMPGGTVVIEKNRQEIAIGAALAKTILVAAAP